MIAQQILIFRCLVLLTCVFLTTGCASLDYYSQSIRGQFELVQKRQKINVLLAQKEIPVTLRKKLKTVLELRNFSINQLNLPNNDSYLSYVDLERKYVIWNIFATEEFSLTPITWCYLVVGCLDYRGYFAESEARLEANNLREQDYDIYLGGVSAYSTLGWFDDPVLNTMMQWSDIRLATVMFHELAHQQLYIKNDTEFNEAYAETVATIGVNMWLQQNVDKNQAKNFMLAQEREKQFISLIMKYKEMLNDVYQSEESIKFMRQSKKDLFQRMSDEYILLSRDWENNHYANWFATEINNAKLTAIVTYKRLVPALIEIYEKMDRDLIQLYEFCELLSNCDREKRRDILEKREIKFEC